MSITKKTLKSGRAAYEVRLRDPDGREYSRTFPTKTAATAWESQQRAEQSQGLWTDPRLADMTFGEVADAWLASNPAKRESSLTRDRSALRTHIKPALGNRKLRSIRPRDLQALVNEWSAKQAPRTVRRQFEVLRAIFNWAVATEMIGRSPTRGVKLPSGVAVRPVRVATASELADLADAVGPSYAAMVWLGAVCGLRWGECAGLRAGRLDFTQRTLAVVEQRTRGEGGRMVDQLPKSLAGRRTLAVPAALMELLRVHLEARRIIDPSSGEVVDRTAHVFVGPEGQPLDYSHFRYRVWVPACEAVGMKGFGFHDLRRTNATQLVLQRIDLKTAQVRLGHSDPRLTLAVYAQAVSEADRDAADRLGAAFLRNG